MSQIYSSQFKPPVSADTNTSRVYLVNQPNQFGTGSRIVRSGVQPSEFQDNLQYQTEDQEQFDEEEVKSDKRCLNLCILLLPFILSILFIVAAVRLITTHLNTTSTLEGSDNVLEFVHDNLNADPIESWRTTLDGNCPNDYEQADLGKWKGINSGCLCQNGKSFQKDSFTECLSFTDDKCDYQYGKWHEHYQQWVNPSVEFCEKRLDEDKWEKIALCDTSVNTYCGASVCVKGVGAQCPPNSIKVQQYSDPSKSISDLLNSFKNSESSNQSQIVIRSATQGNNPSPAIAMNAQYKSGQDPLKNNAFVNFAISQGTTLCLNDDYTRTNNLIYPLDAVQTQNHVCDQYGSLSKDQVVVLDTALQSTIYANNGLQGVYTNGELVDYNSNDYSQNTVNLLAIKKIAVANKKECNAAYDDDLLDSARLAKHSRSVLRFFSWVLLIITIFTVILGIVFVLSALSKKVSSEYNTRVKVAKLYWFSAWVLVGLAFLIFFLYHIFFSYWLGDNEESLKQLKSADCFPQNSGVNVAISRLISYDQESSDKFGPLINELFWYSLVYSLIWLAIVSFWKKKYSYSNFISN